MLTKFTIRYILLYLKWTIAELQAIILYFHFKASRLHFLFTLHGTEPVITLISKQSYKFYYRLEDSTTPVASD